VDTLSLNLLATASSAVLSEDVLRRRGFLGVGVHGAHDNGRFVFILVGGILLVWFGALCRTLLTHFLPLVSGGCRPQVVMCSLIA
jgi:hypothetical protein